MKFLRTFVAGAALITCSCPRSGDAALAPASQAPSESGSKASLTEVVLDAATTLEAPVVLALLDSRLPVVEADIDGCGKARLVVDSAAEITMLDVAFAERCGLAQRPFGIEVLVNAADGSQQRLERVAHVDRLSFGGPDASAKASGLDCPLINLASLPGAVDGILGQDVIGDWALLFLPARRELVLLPSEGLTQRLAEFFPSNTPLESMELQGESRIANIPFSFGDGEGVLTMDLHLDTGATHTSLPRPALEAMGLHGGTKTESTTLGGVGQRMAFKIADFPLGSQRLELIVHDTPDATGLLGYDALSQRAFVLDGPGRRLMVEVRAQ